MKISVIILLSMAVLLGGCGGKLTPEKEEAIQNNLRQIASASVGYMLEEGVDSVTYLDLAGDYFAPIKSVAGESYEGITIRPPINAISVKTASGEVVSLDITQESWKIRGLSETEQ